MQSLDFLRVFIDPLEENKIPYFVTGSVASIFYGEPRLTHDIDIVIHLDPKDVSRFVALFPLEHFYCPPDEVIRIEIQRRPFGHFNLIYHETGFKADIYPDAADPFHQWAFENRKRIELGTNLALWLAPPEYVIIRKLEYFREGGSEKHLEDIAKMLAQLGDDVDSDFLESEVEKRSLGKAWKRVR